VVERPEAGGQDLAVSSYRLEPLTEEHISERYVAWLNDRTVNQFLEVRFERQTRDTVAAFVQSFSGATEKYAWAIRAQDGDGDFVGTCTIYDVDRHHGTAHFGIMVGDQQYWGSGCSAEAITLLLEYAFDVLGLRRVAGNCYSSNRGMAFTFKKLGFTHEGTARYAYEVGPGRYVHGYLWGILAEEWRARQPRKESAP
jgi:ribosomal-protein-alanine N-acetyltransferase